MPSFIFDLFKCLAIFFDGMDPVVALATKAGQLCKNENKVEYVNAVLDVLQKHNLNVDDGSKKLPLQIVKSLKDMGTGLFGMASGFLRSQRMGAVFDCANKQS